MGSTTLDETALEIENTEGKVSSAFSTVQEQKSQQKDEHLEEILDALKVGDQSKKNELMDSIIGIDKAIDSYIIGDQNALMRIWITVAKTFGYYSIDSFLANLRGQRDSAKSYAEGYSKSIDREIADCERKLVECENNITKIFAADNRIEAALAKSEKRKEEYQAEVKRVRDIMKKGGILLKHNSRPEFKELTPQEAEDFEKVRAVKYADYSILDQGYAMDLTRNEDQFAREQRSRREKLAEQHDMTISQKDKVERNIEKGKYAQSIVRHAVATYLGAEMDKVLALSGPGSSDVDKVREAEFVVGRVQDISKKLVSFYSLLADKCSKGNDLYDTAFSGMYRDAKGWKPPKAMEYHEPQACKEISGKIIDSSLERLEKAKMAFMNSP